MNRIEGRRFGRIFVVKATDERKNGCIAWLCRCDCGIEVVASSGNLVSGHTRSCGCLGREVTAARNRAQSRHGHAAAETREYNTWHGMFARCRNPKSTSFSRYGGRGIGVCERWRSFENFLEDMGPRPPGMSLDRIDCNGNYEPSNCRWATAVEQQNGKRSNVRISIDGADRTIAEWSRVTGTPHHRILRRIRRGWEPALAVFGPRVDPVMSGRRPKLRKQLRAMAESLNALLGEP